MSDEEIKEHLLEEAHERGTKALSEIAAHERVCIVRYEGIEKQMKSIACNQKTMQSRMWKVSGIIIVMLLGIIGSIANFEVHRHYQTSKIHSDK